MHAFPDFLELPPQFLLSRSESGRDITRRLAHLDTYITEVLGRWQNSAYQILPWTWVADGRRYVEARERR